jgi:hypothetical protein
VIVCHARILACRNSVLLPTVYDTSLHGERLGLASLFLVSSIAGLVQPSWRRALLVVPATIIGGLALETVLDTASTGRLHPSAGLLTGLLIAAISILTGAASGRAVGGWLAGRSTASSWLQGELAS